MTVRSLALAITLLVAGCLGADAPPTAAPATAPPTATAADSAATGDPVANASVEPSMAMPMVLRQGDCVLAAGIFAVPMDAARAALPPLLPPAEVVAGSGFAGLVLPALDCGAGDLDGAAVPEVAAFGAFLLVAPPPELADATALAQLAPIGTYLTDARLAAVFDEWDLGGGSASSVTIEVPADTPAAAVTHVAAASDEIAFDLVIANAGPASKSPDLHVRFFGVDEGIVTSIVDSHWSNVTMVLAGTEYRGPATASVSKGLDAFRPAPAPDNALAGFRALATIEWRHESLSLAA